MNRQKLMIRQVSAKIEEIRSFSQKTKGISSWIQYIRKALGMSAGQLAKRADMAQSSLFQLERKEKEKAITLKSLERVANAMDCDFIYAFVPRNKVEEMIDEQSYKKAKEIVLESHLHMEYEMQDVDKEKLKRQVEDLTEELKKSKKLWD